MPATERYPWTDEQVERAFEAAERTTVGFDIGDIRELLRGFQEAGITVDIPEPPAASYEVREGHCLMYGIVPLRWYGSNREGAEAEAERLRESGEITVEDYAAKAWAIRDLDAAREEIRHLKVRQAGDAGQIVGLRYRAEVAEDRADRYEAALRSIATYRSGGAPADVARKALGRIAESL